ncbi:MAG: hypothetical protein ACHQ1H_12565 [Nitrososphaerales archaeon]
MNSIAVSGIILSAAGALLDFFAGYLILSQSTITTMEMGVTMSHYNSNALVWGVGISLLGVILVVTEIVSLTSIGMGRMNIFGFLMMGYGVLMLFIGTAMYSGVAPMMNYSVESSAGMFVAGALMLVNGGLMVRGTGAM